MNRIYEDAICTLWYFYFISSNLISFYVDSFLAYDPFCNLTRCTKVQRILSRSSPSLSSELSLPFPFIYDNWGVVGIV